MRSDLIDPETANFQKLFLGLAIIGHYLGIIVEHKVLSTSMQIYHYDTPLKITIARMAFIGTCNAIMMAPILLLISSKKHPLWVVVTFKKVMPACLLFFGHHTLGKWITAKLGL